MSWPAKQTSIFRGRACTTVSSPLRSAHMWQNKQGYSARRLHAPSGNPMLGFARQLCVSRDYFLQEPLRLMTSGFPTQPINNQNYRKNNSMCMSGPGGKKVFNHVWST